MDLAATEKSLFEMAWGTHLLPQSRQLNPKPYTLFQTWTSNLQAYSTSSNPEPQTLIHKPNPKPLTLF